jgi:hypothetical protein
MCPFCVAAAVWIAAGTVSTGGISALAFAKLSKKNPDDIQPISETRSQP